MPGITELVLRHTRMGVSGPQLGRDKQSSRKDPWVVDAAAMTEISERFRALAAELLGLLGRKP